MMIATLQRLTTSGAEAISRRASVRTLGGAAIVSALAPFGGAGARKTGRNRKRNRRCGRQGFQCRAFFAERCQKFSDPASCEAEFFPCCGHFARGAAAEGLDCIFPVAEEA